MKSNGRERGKTLNINAGVRNEFAGTKAGLLRVIEKPACVITDNDGEKSPHLRLLQRALRHRRAPPRFGRPP